MPYLALLKGLPWKLIGIAGLALAFMLMFAALKMEKAHSAKLQNQIMRCTDQRTADRDAYFKAQADAKAMNLAQVKAVEQRQKGITDAVSKDLEARLVRLRYELRAKPATASGVARGADASGAAKPATSVANQAGMPLSPSDLLLAAEYEEKLDQWITWSEGLKAGK